MASPSGDPLLHGRIREYEILELIGQGGMGSVYRARHVFLDEERAIKFIRKGLFEDQEFVQRFIREAKILTKLHHPNLVQFYEFGTLEDLGFFMVLEFLRGESVLLRIQNQTRFEPAHATRIIRDAALGLQAAHQKGIVHRDISPDNLLLVNEDGRETTKVIDFGIALPNLEIGQKMTATNTFLGRPEYCSPEQCGMLADGEVLDGRSDIYSLGITFYQMLTGHLPYEARNAQEYFLKHISEPPKPLTEFLSPGEFARPLNRILERMLAKRRDERYPSLAEFLNDLEQLENAEAGTVDGPMPKFPELQDPAESGLFAKRFVIEKLLGSGGMGKVYKAKDTILGVPVAIKVISKRSINNPDSLERFKREVVLARKVSHQNACRIYDIGESDGTQYVSMEYMEGQTLAELLENRGRLKADEALPIINQVLEGLRAVHRAGIIHRDLKPQNIMVEKTGRACIMDFGISVSSDVKRLTETGMIVGTLHYMSPEQLKGANVDQRSDIYSIGVILFEVLTGRLPFNAPRPAELILAQISEAPTMPSQLVADFPAELERVILTALEKTPDKRFQKVSDLLAALSGMSEPKTLAGKQESVLSRLGNFDVGRIAKTRQAKRKLMTTGVMLLISIFGYVWILQHENSGSFISRPVIALKPVSVSVNATPWAYVEVLSAASSVRVKIPKEEAITPCSFSLLEGEYKVQLQHPGLPTVTQQVKVKRDQLNSFQFKIPSYDAERIVDKIFK